ncbi:duplicated homeodomain-like superfamily protein [Striga asiatica]|uniref:Duplicated homeodomain-like superfamily protein n=1 Tax=Striga asiatica TaxID=4170 RepID=A0A5A7R9L3_STRAF|nr:duplicated homeodomain-like superfamily protein [Striga asiatica]
MRTEKSAEEDGASNEAKRKKREKEKKREAKREKKEKRRRREKREKSWCDRLRKKKYRQMEREEGEKERGKREKDCDKDESQFLLGLKKYGKGDWRNISRNFVTTRTPTQVASHAQKYFIRQLSGGKDKRRSSIHDITTVNLDEIKSPSPEKNNGPLDSPEKQNLILQVQQHNLDGDVVVRPNYEPGLKSPGAVLGFSPIMAHFQGTSGYSGLGPPHFGQHHGTVFQMNPH